MPGRMGQGNRRMGQDNKWWCRKFSERGYRITEPRQIIIEVLCNTDKHLSAEEVYHHVHRKFCNIGLATVYRTLDLLSNLGVINKFDFGDGRARYELIKGPKAKHHHHLICKQCGMIINYTDYLDEEIGMINKVEAMLEKKHAFKITNHNLHFYGICKNCRLMPEK